MLFLKINFYIANKFPVLGKPKRLFLAYLTKYLSKRSSYAQLEDDKIAINILKTRLINRPFFYIDVGANHPTRLSNTYLMYREGGCGITIDPNHELMWLHRLIRPRDIQLTLGCGKKNELLKFYSSKTPVLSSFSKSQVNNVHITSYLPVFTLDKICEPFRITDIDFLSIDVEGLDLEVLEGANKVLYKTYLVCVEANSIENEIAIISHMRSKNFELKLKNKWNLFFINKKKII